MQQQLDQAMASLSLAGPRPDPMRIPPKENCAICLLPLRVKDGDEVIMLECNHFFHKSCITRHQATIEGGNLAERARTCPLCRQPTPTLYSDGVWRFTKLRF